MHIHRIRTLAGPNIYSHRPMLAMELDLGELYEVESYQVEGFIDRLITLLPGLHDHHCASGQPGGFIKRLHEGTYFGHIVEHVALELTDAAGISTNRGKTVAADVPGRYIVAVEYQSEAGMKCLLETAVALVESLVRNEPFALEEQVQRARDAITANSLGPSTRAIVDAAARRGIPWARVNSDSRIRLGIGKAIRHVEATVTDRTSVIAVDLASNKDETKRVLREVGLPVPQGCVVETREAAIACFEHAPAPVVVKPLDSNQGRGVSLNLTSAEQVGEAFDLARENSSRVIVEEMFRGNDYRVVVVNGRMVAAAQRIPAHVWGDGVHTIRELIDLANHDPRRGDHHEKPMTKIHADPLVIAILKRHGRTLDDVPDRGAQVLLRDSANLSTGGEARDVTDRVHPTLRRVCERAARVIGLDVCGVDLVLPDIEQPLTTGGIVEVNAAPGIRMHHFPAEGESRDVGGAIIDMLYPEGTPSRIPVVAITGTNGKTTVTRMAAHVLGHGGDRTVGMTTTDGIWIAGAEVATGDMTGPWSANVVLSDPSVDVAVLETARGGIMRGGLAFDWCDVGVITNIQSDHFGQDGISDLEDIAHVKRLVAERVREGGTLVLNADDAMVVKQATHPSVTRIQKRIVYFSLSAHSEVVRAHLAAGGTALVLNGGWLEERTGEDVTRLVSADALPSTFNGTAAFQVANVLAAIAAARAAGATAADAVAALTTFQMCEHGSGRLNVYMVGGGYAVVDYAHNPSAIASLCRAASKWNVSRLTVVLGVPGDRRDDLIKDSARAVLGVDRVIVREDEDTRGRNSGAVARILAGVLSEEAPTLPVEIVLDELDAASAAATTIQPREAVLLLCDRVDEVVERLRTHGAEPLADPGALTARRVRVAQPAA
jgi:cyanophycin synthetase